MFHLKNEQVGWINGTAFWGMVVGGPLCDLLGRVAILPVILMIVFLALLLTQRRSRAAD